MKVIIKKPKEKYGIFTDIPNELETLQKIVGGYIEVAPYHNALIICNENGKILNLPKNINYEYDYIAGTIIVCGHDREDFSDVPITMEQWKIIMDMENN